MKKEIILGLIFTILFISGCGDTTNGDAPSENSNEVHSKYEAIDENGMFIKIYKTHNNATYVLSDNRHFIVEMDVSITGEDTASKIKRGAIGNIAFNYYMKIVDTISGEEYFPEGDVGFSGDVIGDSIRLIATFDNEISKKENKIHIILYNLEDSSERYIFEFIPNYQVEQSDVEVNAPLCEVLPHHDITCYTTVAQMTENQDYCEYITTSPSLKLQCMAVANKDKSFCKGLTKMGHDDGVCESYVDSAILGKLKCTNVEDLGGEHFLNLNPDYTSNCFLKYVVSETPSDCNIIENEELKELCENVVNNDELSCESLSDDWNSKINRHKCHINMAVYRATH
ncbi:hypothetical protein HOD61_00420 [archaeon]|nr:hypothetical protein [archaeon]